MKGKYNNNNYYYDENTEQQMDYYYYPQSTAILYGFLEFQWCFIAK